MNKIFSLLMCLLIAGTTCAARKRSSSKDPVSLTGEIVYKDPAAISDDTIPTLDVYYGATHTVSSKTGMYTLKIPASEKESLKDLSLVICKRSQPDFERGATIAGQRIDKPSKCRWYNLERQWNEKKKQHYWDINEKTNVAEGDFIPENAVIINVSGKYVVDLENSEQKIVGHTVLPRIVLKNDVEALKRQSVKSAIAAIDNRMNTSEQLHAKQTKNDVDIDLAYC